MTSTRRPISELERAVAARLRAHVAERKVLKVDLAKAIGAHRTHVSRVLNGHVHISLDELADLCEVIGIDVRQVIAEALESLPASDALLDQLDEQHMPVQATSDNIRATKLEPDAG